MSRIRIRRGTAAAWTSANPTLALAELGYETDTGKLKVGDGTTAWTSLAYFASGSGIPESLLDAKGDLIVASADDTAARLPAGTDGYVLTADSGETLGVKWDAVGSGGPPSGAAGGVLSGTYPNPGFAADMATQAELDAHTGDTSAAHAAAAIAFTPAGTISATDVQAAIEEVAAEGGGGGGSEWSVLTNGDATSPEIVFADGDVVMVES